MAKIRWMICLLAVAITSVLIDLPATSAARPANQPIDVWLDVDTTNGLVDSRPHDVDDGLAVLFALHSPELSVRGVSVCFGNGRLDQTLPIARDLLARFAPDNLKTPFAGAASQDDLGKETDATAALENELKRRPLVVLALGPVTTVATVIKNHPELMGNIRQIIVVAGRRKEFGFHPPGRPELIFPDANFEKDVPAMQVLLDSKLPIVFAGYEVSSDVWITRTDLQKLGEINDCGKWINETSQPWIARWEQVQKLKGFNPFDTLAIGWLMQPENIESIDVITHIETGPDDRASASDRAAGKTKCYLICEPSPGETSQKYCTSAKPDFIRQLLQRLPQPP